MVIYRLRLKIRTQKEEIYVDKQENYIKCAIRIYGVYKMIIL